MRIVTALVALIAFACPASAAQLCLPYQDAFKKAYRERGELPSFIALTQSGVVLTVTINPETHTYSIWGQGDPEIACLLNYGDDWREAPEAVRNGPLEGA